MGMSQQFHFSVIPQRSSFTGPSGSMATVKAGGITQDIPTSSNGAHYLPSPHINNYPTFCPSFCQHPQLPKLKIAYLTINHLSYFCLHSALPGRTSHGLDNGLQWPPAKGTKDFLVIKPTGQCSVLSLLDLSPPTQESTTLKASFLSTLLHHSLPFILFPWSHSVLSLACHSLIA